MEEMNLEEMRNQFAILKEQLAKQEIVSDRLIRETIKVKNRDIKKAKLAGYTWAVLALPLLLLLYFTHMTGLAFVIATYLLIGIAVVSTYYIHKPVDKLNFTKDNLATVAHVMAEFKKQYNRGLINSLFVCILWTIWFCFEIWKHHQSDAWIFIILALFGGISGGISGFRDCRKAMNAAQEIVDEIENNE